MKQLKLKNDLPEEKRKKVLVKYSEIKSSLNGVGRIIKYDVRNKMVHPDNNSITLIEEGKFRNGLLDGYARRYNAPEQLVEAGFFKEDVANGKYQRWNNTDG
jgi:hypothetical protein